MQERLLPLLVVTVLCGLWENETGGAQELSRIADAVLEDPSPND